VRVLVTGGAGFIGSHTVDALLSRGHRVRVLDSLQPRVHPTGWPAHLDPEAERIHGDVRSRADIERALDGVEAVVHLAAYQDYMDDFSTFLDTNARGTALLFELAVARSSAVHTAIVASSQAVAGDSRYACAGCLGTPPPPDLAAQVADPAAAGPWLDDPRCRQPPARGLEQLATGVWEHLCPACGEPMAPLLMQETLVDPWTPYGISKHAAERLAIALGRRCGIRTAAMRYTYAQGTRNAWQNPYSGLLRRLALAYRTGTEPTIYEDGAQLRDFVNVRDVALANVVVLEDPPAEPTVYNVGGGCAVTVGQVAAAVARLFGAEPPRPTGAYRLGDTRHTVSDVSRLAERGWRPTRSYRDSIAEYVDWLSGQQVDVERLRLAEAEMARHGIVRRVVPAIA
jgi:dTDP-L-rhamnose 4-epimerase